MVRARARVATVRGATSCAMVPPLAPTERDHDTPRLARLGLGLGLGVGVGLGVGLGLGSEFGFGFGFGFGLG